MTSPRNVYAACALMVALVVSTQTADAECLVEGVTHVHDVRATASREVTDSPMAMSQAMRVSFQGTDALLEGVSPIAFRARVPSHFVALYIGRSGVFSSIVGAAIDTPVEVTQTERDEVTATVGVGDLRVRGVRIPCASLSTRRHEGVRSAPVPAFEVNPRWITRSTSQSRTLCRSRGSLGLCSEEYVGRCRPRGDGSECGYHPRGRSLRVFHAGSASARFVDVDATREVLFIDDDGRGPWIRVTSNMVHSTDIVVRGWVRRADVQWAQEPRAAFGMGRMDTMGRGVSRSTRGGFIVLAPQTPVLDAQNNAWGSVSGSYCTNAEQVAGSETIGFVLPGRHDGLTPRAWVRAANARWVQACPAGP